MKSTLRVSVLFILALVLGVVLAPRVYSLAHQTGSTFQDQVNALISQTQNYAQATSPAAAAFVPAILAGAGALAAALFLYLLLFVPLRLYAMQRAVRRQGDQIEALRREIYLSSDLFLDARKNFREEHEIAEKQAGAKSDLRRFIFPGLHEGGRVKKEAH